MLRRILGFKRGEVTGGRRKLQNEQISNLFSVPNIIRMIKLKGMTWVGIACMGR